MANKDQTLADKLHELGVEYLDMKEIRDHYDGLMKEVSKGIDAIMVQGDFAAYKEGIVSISMSNTSKTSVKGFLQALIDMGVDANTLADGMLKAKPEPKYSPRISKLKKESKPTMTKGIGG